MTVSAYVKVKGKTCNSTVIDRINLDGNSGVG